MSTISVIYHSGLGNTERLARAVATGAERSASTKVTLSKIEQESIVEGRFDNELLLEDLDASDAIVFGAPTYMGMVSGPFKCFADATAGRWFDMRWKDKVAGGFTTSGYASGDKVMTLHYLATLATQLRMLWIGPAAPPSNLTGDGRDVDRWGFYLGIGACGNAYESSFPDNGDILTAELYGERIAQATERWVTNKTVARAATEATP